MKIKQYAAMLLCMGCLVSGCSVDDSNELNDSDVPVYLFGNLSDEIKKDLPFKPVKTLDGMGEGVTDIDLYNNFAYVVDSMNNVIHRIHLDELSVDKNYIDLGQNAAPYAVYADDNGLYVAVQGKKSVIKFPPDKPNEPVVLSDNLIAPSAIYSYNDLLFYADSEYDYNDASKTGGKVHVITKENEHIELVSSYQNTGFLDYCPTYDWIFAVNSGIVSFYPEVMPPEKSCVDLWDAKNLSVAEENKPAYTFCVDNTSLGRMSKSQGTLYMGDALKPVIHGLWVNDVPKGKGHIEDIVLSDDSTGLTTPVDMGTSLAVVEFNHDMLYFRKDQVLTSYRLSKTQTLNKGPIDAVYDAKHKQLLILNSIAGSVDVFKVEY